MSITRSTTIRQDGGNTSQESKATFNLHKSLSHPCHDLLGTEIQISCHLFSQVFGYLRHNIDQVSDQDSYASYIKKVGSTIRAGVTEICRYVLKEINNF